MPKPAPALWLATVMASISPSVGADSPHAPAFPADGKPYFTEAAAGRAGRFFALGTTSLKRGYYFSAPISVRGEIRGRIETSLSNLETLENAD